MALITLVADSNIASLFEGFLPRVNKSYADIAPLPLTKPIVHVGRDPGVVNYASVAARPFSRQPDNNLLVVLDYHGCGAESKKTAQQLERQILNDLERNGWSPRSDGEPRVKVVVVVPEIDVWIWINRNKLASILDGNRPCPPSIDQWLTENDFHLGDLGKPVRPKEAFEALLLHIDFTRSSALYKNIAQAASLPNCQDPNFKEIINQLRQWYPAKR